MLLIDPHIQHLLSLDSIDTDQIERRINYVGQQGAATHARDTYYSKSEKLPNTFTKNTTTKLGSSEIMRHIQRNSRHSFEDSEKGKLHLRLNRGIEDINLMSNYISIKIDKNMIPLSLF